LYGQSRTTAIRALDQFAAKFGENVPLNSTSASLLAQHIVSDSEVLMSTLAASLSQELSKTEEVAMRTSSALGRMNKVLQKRHYMLGVYHATAKQKKMRQQHLSSSQDRLGDVINEVWKSSATWMLVDFDRTWWTLRNKLDEYLEASDRQDHALSDAVSLLNDYTSKCTAGFSDLKWAHARAWKASKEAHTLLRRTWNTVEQELGLLASKIADSGAFQQLQHLDAASVDLASQPKSLLCSGDINVAVSAVNETLHGGLADQTWDQLESVVMETPILKERFLASGLEAPAGQALEQAWQRLATSYLEAKEERGELAAEMVKRFRESNCGGISSWVPSVLMEGLVGLEHKLFG
jgi:hypothetical protein